MQSDPLDQLTLVCVTYQSRTLIESLAAAVRPFPHVLIIDNGSSDGTAAAVRRQMPGARVIERAVNGGFGKANNEAMAEVDTPFALLLNPDCAIDTESVTRLLDALDRYPEAGLVAPQSWRSDNQPRKSYRPAFFEPQPRGAYRVADAICCAQWLNACCLLMRTQAFRQVNGFDERFFLFYEDDDLCLRMRRANFSCLFEPAARASHNGGRSSAPSLKTSFIKRFHYARSRHLAICRYQGSRAGRRYLLKIMLAAVPAALIYGLTLRRRHFVKWVAWGCSAVASAARPAIAEPISAPSDATP